MVSSSQEPKAALPSTPKFSFKAALIRQQKKGQPHDEKSATAIAVTTSPTRKTKLLETPAASSSAHPETRIAKPSHIPSLGARTRFNSTNNALPSLPSTSNLSSSSWPSPASEKHAGRPASSLGKRGVEDSSSSLSSQCTPSVSDFGQLPRPRTNSAQSSSIRPPKSKLSKLPGPPSTRGQWSGLAQPARASASPSVGRAASSKIARSDSTNDVHSPSAVPAIPRPPHPSSLTRSNSLIKQVKSATPTGTSATNRGKIGMLPPKPRPSIMVRTILDQKESTSSDSEDDDDSDDSDDLQGPDVSGIKTRSKTEIIKRDVTHKLLERQDNTVAVTGAMQPPVVVNTSSTGKSRAGQRRSSGMSAAARSDAASARSDAALQEKENCARGSSSQEQAPTFVVGTVDKSIGLSHRPRSSLPLAVARPGPQPKGIVEAATPSSLQDEKSVSAKSDKQIAPSSAITEVGSASPLTRTSSLSALRLRGLQPSTPSAGAGTKPAKVDMGIKASILQANPMHPTIAALQSKLSHQPISTPEALNKAKKRLSGALSTSSTSSASPLDQNLSASRSSSKLAPGKLTTPRTITNSAYATLPRTASKSPVKSALRLPNPAATNTCAERGNRKISPSKKATSVSTTKTSPSKREDVDARDPNLSAAEIDASLMASLRVVAKKANLDVKELLQGPKEATTLEASTTSSVTKDDGAESDTKASSASPPADANTLSPAKLSPLKMNSSRFDRAASEDLDSFAGDVSVDLMALNLASPTSDTSMLRSPLAAETAALDTPPSVPAAAALPIVSTPKSSIVGQDQDHVAEDATTAFSQLEDEEQGDGEGERGNSSCGSPSLRAAASRIPKHTQIQQPPLATPTQQQRFVSCSTPAPPPPSSVGMSAKTRSKLRKAIRESIALEALFPSSSSSLRHSLLLSSSTSESNANLASLGATATATDSQGGGGGMTKSVSGILLTEDDRYLDELVDAVAQIGFRDEQQRRGREEAGEEEVVPEDENPFEARLEHQTDVEDEMEALRVQLSAFRDQLSEVESAYTVQTSQLTELQMESNAQRARAAEREIELSKQIAATTRSNRLASWMQKHASHLSAQVAGIEHDKAATAWSTVKTSAMAELEDIKTQNDSLLFFARQLDIIHRLAVVQKSVA